MNQREFDALLRRALMDAAMEDAGLTLAGADDLAIDWSPRYRRRVARLLANPFGTARRHARPAWQRTLQAAACVLLAATVALGGLLAVSPEARAKAWALIGRWFETNTEYSFHGDQPLDDHAVGWQPSWLPPGFEEFERSEADQEGRILYQNTAGDQIIFEYKPIKSGYGFAVDNEHSDYRKISVGNEPGDFYESNDPLWPSFLIWANSQGTTAYCLVAYLDEGQMLQLAESVAIAE